jgi:type IV pilus assembly protein PilC
MRVGIPIHQCLKQLTPHTYAYKKALEHIRAGVDEGKNISTLCAKFPKLFPTIFTDLLSVAEIAGSLTETCLYFSETYENDFDESLKKISTLIEPMLMILMGLIVGFVALSMITPLYGLSQNLGSH